MTDKKKAAFTSLILSEDPGFWGHLYGPDGTLLATIPDNGPVHEATARQIEHRYNNFMRALEALKKCRNHLSGDPAFGACPLKLDELIRELEEVS